jgi:glycine hydroxymethyltransferase
MVSLLRDVRPGEKGVGATVKFPLVQSVPLGNLVEAEILGSKSQRSGPSLKPRKIPGVVDSKGNALFFMNPVVEYLSHVPSEKIDTSMLAYLCNLQEIAQISPEIAGSIVKELASQRRRIKLIASENYCSPAVQFAMGNLLTDKYAEGMPAHRFYAGNENVDAIESLAARTACELFGAEYANVQPHCGVDANLLAYWAILTARIENPALARYGQTNLYKLTNAQWQALKTELGNQKLLGLDYYSGGHLTHGYRYNVSARMFDGYSYSVSKETGLLDYDDIERQALEIKPFILLAGYSAYPRKINFRRMREIADKTGAVFMVDMAHFAGLVAGKVFTGDYDPVPHAHVVTTTTHKTLRGPRAGLILSTAEFAEALDKGCPLTMGGPLPHVIAAKAVALKEAGTPEFQNYACRIVENAQALAASCGKNGMEILTGGTDNHLFLANVRSLGLTGRQAESALFDCNITLNRNSLPFDPNGPWYTSGLRIGTAAVTTLSMGVAEMEEIGAIIALVLKNTTPAGDSKAKYSIAPAAQAEALVRVGKLLSRFPVYPQLDLALLTRSFT